MSSVMKTQLVGKIAAARQKRIRSIVPGAGAGLGFHPSNTLIAIGASAGGPAALSHHGHHTIAQDEHTSAVYDMPRAAAELLPLAEIGPRLVALVCQIHVHV